MTPTEPDDRADELEHDDEREPEPERTDAEPEPTDEPGRDHTSEE